MVVDGIMGEEKGGGGTGNLMVLWEKRGGRDGE